MLLANFFADQFAAGLGWMMLFIGAGIYLGKKFSKAHPGVAEAAKKAATSKTIDLIGRLLK